MTKLKIKNSNRAEDDISFDAFLTDLLLRWVAAKPRMIDTEMRRSVMEIGEFYRVDSVDFRKFSGDRSATVSLHWWVRNNAVGVFTELQNKKIPWATSLVLRNQIVRISRLDDMPPEATAGRALLQESALQAAIALPLIVDDRVYGALILASQTERDWSDEIERQLRRLGNAMAGAYSRAQRFNALWASEEQIRTVVENQTEFIVRALPNGTRTWVNDSYCKYFQQSRESIIGTSFLPLVAPEDQQKLRAFVDDFSPEHPVQSLEVRVLLPSGEIGWNAWIGTGNFGESGELVEIQSVGRDITDQKRAEEALRQSEEKYRTLFEASNDAILVMEAERIVDCNGRATEILQRDREDLIGMTPWEFSSRGQPGGSASEEMRKAILSDVYSGKFRCFESVHERPDGTPIDMEISLTPVDLETTRPRIFVVGRDITTAKRAQREIERRADFQTGLAEMSSRLLQGTIGEAMSRIEAELARVGVQYDLGRVAIGCVRGDAEVLESYLSWQGAQGDAVPQNMPEQRSDIPWFADRIRKGETIIIRNMDELPDEAQLDRASMQAWGLKSTLVCPVQMDSQRVGWCVYSCFEERNWEEATVQELRLTADTIISACALANATDELISSERKLALSQEVAGVGSYSISYDGAQVEEPVTGDLDVSAEFRELFALDSGPVSIELAMTRVHPDDFERMLKSLTNVVQAGIRDVETFRVVRPDGTIRHVENRFQIIAGGPDGGKTIFGTCQDVTEQVDSTRKIEKALAEIKDLKDKLQEENLQLRQEVRAAQRFDKIIGDSPTMRKALAAAEKVAPTDVPVLILGETGTGKELVAQGIHKLSRRKDKPMVSVNCAALSRELVESELFGHEKGSFTGAHSQRRGRFERADGGVLFLDEIGELSGELQAKLLRVLQTGDFERLGGTATLNVDVRLIVATNKDLRRAVDNGEFRADLYYRIASFPIELPPLRERKDDIPALAEHLVQKHAKRMGKAIQAISARTIRYLVNQDWPGNVRELEGVIQRALISAVGPVLDYAESDDDEPQSDVTPAPAHSDDVSDLRTAERQHILRVLNETGWVIDGKRGAAVRLGVAPSTLRSKMKRLNIERPA